MRDQTNMTAIAIPGSIPRDMHRTYLSIFATSDVTVTISSGNPFVIKADTQWGPQPAPMNDIAFSGNGTLITG